MALPPWLAGVLACPDCGGRLGANAGATLRDGALVDGLLGCAACAAPYPVLGGVPILVPDPGGWAAAHREAALAALAEAGRATPEAVELVRSFAASAPEEAPRRFPHPRDAGLALVPAGSPAADAFAGFLAAAQGRAPRERAAALLGDVAGLVVSVGERFGDADIAVLASLRDALGHDGALVADPSHLPLQPGVAEAIVAIEAPLEAPLAFLHAAFEALAPEGRLLLATPTPPPGSAGLDDDVLAEMLVLAGFSVTIDERGAPTVRHHGGAHWQVGFARVWVGVRGDVG